MGARTRFLRGLAAAVTVGALAAGCGGDGGDAPLPVPRDGHSTSSGAATRTPRPPPKPLAGKVVVLDPGHQLGNRNFRSEINASVDAGGFEKACNTTGTATNGGYAEATFTWEVAVAARQMLRRMGARVVLTRSTNADDAWGPCIDERGRIGNPGQPGPDADVRVSIHGDGELASGAHGFHVIRPGVRQGWTDDIERPSRRLAAAVRDALVGRGFATSSYAGTDGIDVRTDLGTLNNSDVPVVMVELGNMRNADDAALMGAPTGRREYARSLARGIRDFLR